MTNKFGLPDRTISELLGYFKAKTDVVRVVIFGSRARGSYKDGSDIDFAISSDIDNVFEISAELDELPTPYMFDVIDYKTLTNEKLKNSIDTEGVEFYRR